MIFPVHMIAAASLINAKRQSDLRCHRVSATVGPHASDLCSFDNPIHLDQTMPVVLSATGQLRPDAADPQRGHMLA